MESFFNNDFFTNSEKFMPYVILIINIILVLLAGRILRYSLLKILKKTLKTQTEKMSQRKIDTLLQVFSSIIKYLILFIEICIILQLFNISLTSVLAVAGVGGVAIGFGAQSLVKDFLTGLFIIIEDQFGVTDVVTLSGITGTVEAIGMRTTRIRSLDGSVHIIPNSNITMVTNYNKEFARSIVDIAISYKEDINHIIDILTDECEKLSLTIEGLRKPVEILGITELGTTSIILRLAAECEAPRKWAIEREIRLAIKSRLDKEGAKSPFPQLSIQEK